MDEYNKYYQLEFNETISSKARPTAQQNLEFIAHCFDIIREKVSMGFYQTVGDLYKLLGIHSLVEADKDYGWDLVRTPALRFQCCCHDFPLDDGTVGIRFIAYNLVKAGVDI